MHATDWDFLLSRADACNKLILADDGKLSFKAPDLSTEPVLSLTYGANILEFEAEMDARGQYAEVNGQSWDNTSLEVLELDSADDGSAEPGNLSSSDLAETTWRTVKVR